MKTQIGLLLPVLFLSLYAYGQDEISWITHADSGYSIEYPANWILSTPENEPTLFKLTVPEATAEELEKLNAESTDDVTITSKKDGSNVKLTVEDAKGMDLATFVDNKKKEITAGPVKDLVWKSEQVEVPGGMAYQKVTLTFSIFGQNLYSCTQFRMVKKSVYILALSSGPDSGKSIIETGEKILESFKLE